MVIRLVSVSDRTNLPGLHDAFHAILGWSGDLGYLVRIHGQEFNSFRRSTRSKALRDFQLHRQEKFLYICDVMDLWEWDVRVLDIQQGIEDDPWLIRCGRFNHRDHGTAVLQLCRSGLIC